MDDYKLRNVATKYCVSKEAILNIVKRLDLVNKNLVYIEYDKNDNKQYMFKEEAINAIGEHLLRNPNKIYGKKTMAAECNTTEYKLYSILDKFNLIDDDHIIIRKNIKGKDLYIFDDILVEIIKNYINKGIFPAYPYEDNSSQIEVNADDGENKEKIATFDFLSEVEKDILSQETPDNANEVEEDTEEDEGKLKDVEAISATENNELTDFATFKEKYEKQYAKNNLYGCFETVDGKLKRTLDPQLFIDTVFLYFSDVDKIVEKYNDLKTANDKYEKFFANIKQEIDEENISLETPEKYVLTDEKAFDELTGKYADNVLTNKERIQPIKWDIGDKVMGISKSNIIFAWLILLTVLLLKIISML